MKHAARFLFGAAIGIALGYALTLLVRPASKVRRSRRLDRPSKRKRDSAS
jgi:gas vesicle protein